MLTIIETVSITKYSASISQVKYFIDMNLHESCVQLFSLLIFLLYCRWKSEMYNSVSKLKSHWCSSSYITLFDPILESTYTV